MPDGDDDDTDAAAVAEMRRDSDKIAGIAQRGPRGGAKKPVAADSTQAAATALLAGENMLVSSSSSTCVGVDSISARSCVVEKHVFSPRPARGIIKPVKLERKPELNVIGGAPCSHPAFMVQHSTCAD